MKKYKNFIWDFDGTIFDTYPHIVTAVCRAYHNKGIKISYDKAFELCIISLDKVIDYFGGDKKEILKDYKLLERNLSLEPVATIIDNAEKVLTTIKNRGGQNFLFTHRDKSAVSYLKGAKIDCLFTDIVTTESSAFCQKPSGKSVDYLITNNNLVKEQTVICGDREIDILSGYNAGIDGILIDYYNSGCYSNNISTESSIIKMIDYIDD